jgi:hypothetical protein
MALSNDMVFPIVACPVGPHELSPATVETDEVFLVLCPVHDQVLNTTEPLEILRWVTAEELPNAAN